MPVGVVHIKDLYYEGSAEPDLRKIARPFLTTTESNRLETLLTELRRHRGHLVLVKSEEGKWAGALPLEDVLAEVVGSIEDEFESEPLSYVSDALSPERVVLGVEGSCLEEAIGISFGKLSTLSLPVPKDVVVKAVLERERAMSTYLGSGLAVPHAASKAWGGPASSLPAPKKAFRSKAELRKPTFFSSSSHRRDPRGPRSGSSPGSRASFIASMSATG